MTRKNVVGMQSMVGNVNQWLEMNGPSCNFCRASAKASCSLRLKNCSMIQFDFRRSNAIALESRNYQKSVLCITDLAKPVKALFRAKGDKNNDEAYAGNYPCSRVCQRSWFIHHDHPQHQHHCHHHGSLGSELSPESLQKLKYMLETMLRTKSHPREYTVFFFGTTREYTV